MKIGLAQINSRRCDIKGNIQLHLEAITKASLSGVDAIFFPELSITGYERSFTDELSVSAKDKRFDVFQKRSNEQKIIVGIGAPTTHENDVRISMLIFEPHCPSKTYSKQELHIDEKPYFKEGNRQVLIDLNECKIAPAICYESLQPKHLESSIQLGANIYLASVAKSQRGIDKAKEYFCKASKENSIPILMVNCIGYCDNFESAGQTSAWNKKGNSIGQLNEVEEGILVFDTVTETTKKLK